jgi:hypothetical protein
MVDEISLLRGRKLADLLGEFLYTLVHATNLAWTGPGGIPRHNRGS